MRNGIREFQPRQPLDRQLGATTLNQILRELESLRITRVVNGTFRKLPGGTEITVAPQRGGGTSTPTTFHPFQIFSRQDPESDPENPTYLVTVRPGTLNGVLASNWTDEEECGEEELGYVVLIATATSNGIVSTELSFDSSPPTAEQSPVKWGLPTSFKVLIGLVRGPQVWQVIYDNLSYAGVKRITIVACGTSLPYWMKTPPCSRLCTSWPWLTGSL
jgi:hypothetical protein